MLLRLSILGLLCAPSLAQPDAPFLRERSPHCAFLSLRPGWRSKLPALATVEAVRIATHRPDDPVGPADIEEALRAMPRLRELHFECAVAGGIAAAARAAPGVERLQVSLSGGKGGSLDGVDAFTAVRVLAVSHMVSPAGLDCLARMPSVERVEVCGITNGLEVLRALRGMKGVREVCFSAFDAVPNEAWAVLRELPVREVEVFRPADSAFAVEQLRAMHGLRRLTLQVYELSAQVVAGLVEIGSRPELRELSLPMCNARPTAAQMSEILRIPSLVSTMVLTDEVLEPGALAAATRLRALSIGQGDPARMARLPALPALESYSSHEGSDEAMVVLRGSELIHTINNGAGTFGGAGLAHLPRPERLRALYAGTIDDEGAAALARCTGLRSLRLCNAKDLPSGPFALALRNLVELESLYFDSAPDVDDATLEVAIALPRLQYLFVGSPCRATPAGVIGLARSASLKHVSFAETIAGRAEPPLIELAARRPGLSCTMYPGWTSEWRYRDAFGCVLRMRTRPEVAIGLEANGAAEYVGLDLGDGYTTKVVHTPGKNPGDGSVTISSGGTDGGAALAGLELLAFWRSGGVAVAERATGRVVATFELSDEMLGSGVAFTTTGHLVSMGEAGARWSVSLLELGADTPIADVETAWAQLAQADPAPAYAARRWWFARGGELALLAERLVPAPVLDEAAIVRLVGQLGAPEFARREAASAELAAAMAAIRPRLERARATAKDPEVQARLAGLLARSEQRLLLGCTDGALLRSLRLVDGLGWLEAPAARELLDRLAAGSAGHPLTLAARAAVARRGALLGSAVAEAIPEPQDD